MALTVKITPGEKRVYFFVLPKRHVRLAVLRNRIKRHVRVQTQKITAKIVVRVNQPVTKKNVSDILNQLTECCKLRIKETVYG